MTRHSRNQAASGRTVLCVDDQVDFLDSLRLLLERDGHRVLTASDGSSALKVLEQERIDLLLLDYLMPGISAEEVVAGIRDPTLQVVLLTGYASERPPRELLERMDIQGYCDKGRGPEEILLWTSLALRHGDALRRLHDLTGVLHQILSSCVPHDEALSLEIELALLLERVAATLHLDSALVALAPPPALHVPPSPLEEESSSGVVTPDVLDVVAACGRWRAGVPLSDLFDPDCVESLLEIGLDEGGTGPQRIGVLPLRIEGKWLGSFCFEPAPLHGSPEDELLQFVAGQISQRCESNRGSAIDPVTGLQSRRFWEQLALRELRQAFRFRHPTSLIRIVPTAMPQLRQTAPMQADAANHIAGRFLRTILKGADLAGRGDHDELLLLLSHTDLRGAVRLAGILHSHLEDLTPAFRELATSLRFRVGISSLDPQSIPSGQPSHSPLPVDFFASALRTLERRADEAADPPPGEELPNLRIHARTHWPAPGFEPGA